MERWTHLSALVMALIIVVTSAGVAAAEEVDVIHGQASGNIQVPGDPGTACEDPSGILTPGNAVSVTDEDGTLLAEATLTQGLINNEGRCSYGFTVWGLPIMDQYEIDVDLGTQADMDAVSVSRRSLESKNGVVDFAIKTSVYLDETSGAPAPPPTNRDRETSSGRAQSTGGQIGNTDMYRIVGTFRLLGSKNEEFFIAGGECFGRRGYDDIASGARITVTNELGEIIGVTELEADPDAIKNNICQFTFEVDVPEAVFYSVTMGRRGEMNYSFAEMEEMDWLVELSLG